MRLLLTGASAAAVSIFDQLLADKIKTANNAIIRPITINCIILILLQVFIRQRTAPSELNPISDSTRELNPIGFSKLVLSIRQHSHTAKSKYAQFHRKQPYYSHIVSQSREQEDHSDLHPLKGNKLTKESFQP